MNNNETFTLSNKQRRFIRYTYAVFVDLIVLNLFSQYWDKVHIADFMTSLMVAVLLQFLLQVTLFVEHKGAALFEGKDKLHHKVQRGILTWVILFVSKFIILGVLDFAFGESVHFIGFKEGYHGILPFLIVVIAIMVAEQLIIKLHQSLK